MKFPKQHNKATGIEFLKTAYINIKKNSPIIRNFTQIISVHPLQIPCLVNTLLSYNLLCSKQVKLSVNWQKGFQKIWTLHYTNKTWRSLQYKNKIYSLAANLCLHNSDQFDQSIHNNRYAGVSLFSFNYI